MKAQDHPLLRPTLATTVIGLLGAMLFGAVPAWAGRMHEQVIVPEEDRFTPFELTINAGDIVEWINMDTDDHTVVSDDAFNTTGHKKIDVLLPGTDNGGPGTFQLVFWRPGIFVYYCRFHSHLDDENQPVAPGPDGGIEDTGNFGTPMMGIIHVVSAPKRPTGPAD